MKHKMYIYAAFSVSMLLCGSFLLAYIAQRVHHASKAVPNDSATPTHPTPSPTPSQNTQPSTPTTPPTTPNASSTRFSDDSCVIGGCSGEICGEAQDVQGTASICIYRPEYACFAHSRCERQQNGACGWTQTPEYTACVAHPAAQ